MQDIKPPDLDENFNPIKPPDLDENHQPETSDSLISKLWKSATTPLTDLPSRAGKTVSKWIDPEQGTSGLRSIASAFIESLGNVGSELSNPLNLGMAALSGGESLAAKAGLSSIAKGLSIGSKVAGVPQAIHGAGTILDPNTSIGDKAMGLGEVALGGLPFLHSPAVGKIGESLVSKELPSDLEMGIAPSTKLSVEAQANTKPIDLPLNESKVIGKVDTSIKPNIRLVPNDPNSIIVKNPDPGVIKQVMEKGFVFDSVMDDGTFKMIKSDKPLNLPVLEQEVGTNRPTPANSARMMAGGVTPTDTVKKPSALTETFNFPRAVMASMDFSAPLRQGLPLIHKKQFWTSLDDMFKAWGSEKAYQAIQSDILERPLFKPRVLPNGTAVKSFAEEAGLSLTDLKSLSNREESLMSSWAEKVPGVRRSNRAYTAFLNKLRADTFESLINDSKVFGLDGKTNLPLAREFANFVNTASGRGSLGKLEKSAVTLNTLLFSPRLISSRLTMLNPRYYIMADPTVRKEALKSLFAVAATGTTLTQLGKLAGGTVESNPTSSDFGKLKIGNVRLDPYGGFQQYIVAASRLLSQKSTSSTTGKEYDLNNPKGPFDPTNMDVIKNFTRSKMHPVLGFAWSLLSGQKEMTGQKMNFGTTNPMDNAVSQRFIPILFQDLYSIAQENPKLLPIMGLLNTFGMSSQVYGGQQ